MDRRVVILGILLLILGLALAYLSVQSLFSGIPNYISATQSVQMRPASDLAIPISIYNSSILQIAYNSSVPVGFYLLNSSAYGMAYPKSANSLIQNITMYEGRGVIFIINSSGHGTFPYIQNLTLSTAPEYWDNASVLGKGTYYAVFQNYGNKSSTVSYTILNRSIASLSSSEEGYSYGSLYGNLFGTLFFVAGLVLIFYGFFMSGSKKEEADDDEAGQIYDRLYKRSKVRSGNGESSWRKQSDVGRKENRAKNRSRKRRNRR